MLLNNNNLIHSCQTGIDRGTFICFEIVTEIYVVFLLSANWIERPIYIERVGEEKNLFEFYVNFQFFSLDPLINPKVLPLTCGEKHVVCLWLNVFFCINRFNFSLFVLHMKSCGSKMSNICSKFESEHSHFSPSISFIEKINVMFVWISLL